MSVLLIAIGLIAASGIPGLFFPRRSGGGQVLSVLLASAGSLLGLYFVFSWLSVGGQSELAAPWELLPAPNRRVTFHVGIDGLSAMFLTPVFLVSMLGSIFGLGYWTQAENPRNGRKLRLFYGLMPAGMALLIIARDAILFLFGWECMALSGYFLVTTEDDQADVRDAGWIYLVASHIGVLLLLALFALLRAATGSFALVAVPADQAGSGLVTAMFFLALLGFGLKAGIMPLHVWLPGSHANAPSHVSAMMSGVLLKMGIYGLVRTYSLLPTGPTWWGALLLVLGGISGVLGIALAIGQRDFKRMLAYSSIENIGIIFMGLGLALLGRTMARYDWIALGLGGALLHVWNHSLFKSLLFFASGSLLHAVGTRQMEELGGLAKTMPRTAVCFLIGSAAVCALPPMNGFVSELLIYLGLFETLGLDGTTSYVGAAFAAPVLAMIGALAVACFVKAFGIIFLGAGRSQRASVAHESGPAMLVPMYVLSACCLVIGLLPQLAAPVLNQALASWLPPAPVDFADRWRILSIAPLVSVSLVGWVLVAVAALVVAWVGVRFRTRMVASGLTWDCGYAAPSARMQYTSSSFSEMLVNLFGWALRPRRRIQRPLGVFPKAASFASEVPDVVLDETVLPGSRRLAQGLYWFRWVQQGSVQAYLLYILAILVFLLIWQ